MTEKTMVMPKVEKSVFARALGGLFAGAITPWILTYFSLRGLDYKALGMDSEVIKSFISGGIVTIVVAPETVVLAASGFIFSCRLAVRTIWQAFTKPLPPE